MTIERARHHPSYFPENPGMALRYLYVAIAGKSPCDSV